MSGLEERVRRQFEAQQGSGQVLAQVRFQVDVPDLAAVVDDGLDEFVDDVGDRAQRIPAERAALSGPREQPIPVADDSRDDGVGLHGQRPYRCHRPRPQRVVEPDGGMVLGRRGLQDLADQPFLLLVRAVGDEFPHLVADVGGCGGRAVDGEAADEPVVQDTGEELGEGRYLMGVSADGQQIEAPPSWSSRLSSPTSRR